MEKKKVRWFPQGDLEAQPTYLLLVVLYRVFEFFKTGWDVMSRRYGFGLANVFDTIFTLYVRHYYAKLGQASRKVFSDAGHADGPSGR